MDVFGTSHFVLYEQPVLSLGREKDPRSVSFIERFFLIRSVIKSSTI